MYIDTVKGREGSFNLARLSFMSVISEEGEASSKDPLKVHTCPSASPQILEDGVSEMEEVKVCPLIELLLKSCTTSITLNFPYF